MTARAKASVIAAVQICFAASASNVVLGQTTTWKNTSADHLWNNPLNWTNGVPTANVRAEFSNPPGGTVIVPDGATARQVSVYGSLSFTGGTLATPFVYVEGGTVFQTTFVPYATGIPTLSFRGGTIQGGISGAQDVTLDGNAKILVPVTYTGTTLIRWALLDTAGAITSSSAINLDGPLSLQYPQGSVDRIANAIPIHLAPYATLSLTNTGTLVASEQLGAIYFDGGQGRINVTGGTTASRAMNVTVDSLNRPGNAVGMLAFGTNASLNVIHAPSQIGGGGGAGTVTRSIVPWLSGKAPGDVLPKFVTIDGGFARPLGATEFASTLNGVPATANVRDRRSNACERYNGEQSDRERPGRHRLDVRQDVKRHQRRHPARQYNGLPSIDAVCWWRTTSSPRRDDHFRRGHV
jgi:hypothetical protein